MTFGKNHATILKSGLFDKALHGEHTDTTFVVITEILME